VSQEGQRHWGHWPSVRRPSLRSLSPGRLRSSMELDRRNARTLLRRQHQPGSRCCCSHMQLGKSEASQPQRRQQCVSWARSRGHCRTSKRSVARVTGHHVGGLLHRSIRSVRWRTVRKRLSLCAPLGCEAGRNRANRATCCDMSALAEAFAELGSLRAAQRHRTTECDLAR
jgi:hypothetical protein